MRVYDSPHENELIDGRVVGSVLDEAERNGAITYDKPRERLRREDEGGRDLFAHAALYRAGWRGFTVLDERNSSNTPKDEWSRYKKSIDLVTSDGVYWEIKSPTAQNPGERLRAVERKLWEAQEQFAGHPRTDVSQTRVVLNGKYINATDEAISRKIDLEMGFRSSIVEVVQVRKDGSLEWHRRR